MRLHRLAILAALSIAFLSAGAAAASAPVQAPANEGTLYLCTGRLALRHPRRCPAAGPASRIQELSIQGLYASRPLPTVSIDPGLGYLRESFLRVGKGGTSIYGSADGAASGRGANGSVQSGFTYLSYTDMQKVKGNNVFQVGGGEYVRGDNVSRVETPATRGLAFRRTPSRAFAWVVGGTYTQITPGGVEDYTRRWLGRYQVVQIYATERVGDLDWYKVGEDEWVEQRQLAVVRPDPTPPEGVDSSKWISVDLFEQTISVYEDGELVYATLASTGQYGTWTQPGLFQVWAKLERDDMTGGLAEFENYYFLEDVPWVLYFDQARALHGTYWHDKFGYTTSRGCVNLTPGDARWIFDFAEEGTWVHVYDPSGQTPTDPALYGAGGA